jgi:hypothetical protein
MKKRVFFAALLVCLLGFAPGVSFAASADIMSHGSHDHVSFGSTIDINEGDSASDIVCAFCSVRIHGNVSGDMVAFFSNVSVDNGKTISGDTVVFGGKLALADESHIDGQLVLFGGDLQQASSAVIQGDRVVMEGSGWLLITLLPFLIPIGIIWLIIHLIRRNRYQFPAYPGGRRY